MHEKSLTEQKNPVNILKDNEFEKSREVLAAKQKSLVLEHGNKPQAAQAIDEDEEDALFEAGECGDPNRVALQGTALRFASKRISVIRHCLLPLQFFSTGANVRSINGCTFQKFHDYVKIVQNERKRRIVIENDEDD